MIKKYRDASLLEFSGNFFTRFLKERVQDLI